MKDAQIMALLALVMCAVMAASTESDADVIKFKNGGKSECVVLKETDSSVKFLSSMGTCTMPRRRIESIEYQSDEVNEALKESWSSKKTRTQKEPEPEPEPEADKKPTVQRTYEVELTKRRIMLGGRDAGVRTAVATATYKFEDFGMVEGSRLFRVAVTSFQSAPHRVKASDFYGLLENSWRVDPEPLEGYESLDGRLNSKETTTGYLAFPQGSALKTIIVRSDLADFDLDLESGTHTVPRGLF